MLRKLRILLCFVQRLRESKQLLRLIEGGVLYGRARPILSWSHEVIYPKNIHKV